MHYPIDYSQSVNSPEACRKRLFKYVIPVIIISTIINIPKFLESYVETYYKVWDAETNTTKTIVDLQEVTVRSVEWGEGTLAERFTLSKPRLRKELYTNTFR